MGGERRAEVLGEIRHRGNVADLTLVQPAHQLAGTKGLAAETDDVIGQFRLRQTEQIYPRGQSSVSRKKYAISRAAVSAASEPWTVLASILSARSARIVPGAAFLGSVTTGSKRCGMPVSYTHLRAHETVLDLVCRLLLEKKKQTPQTTTLLCI